METPFIMRLWKTIKTSKIGKTTVTDAANLMGVDAIAPSDEFLKYHKPYDAVG